jgi:hypothetical protein
MNAKEQPPNKVFADSIEVWLASNHPRWNKRQFRGCLESENRNLRVLSDRSRVFEVVPSRSGIFLNRNEFVDQSVKWSRISHRTNEKKQMPQNELFQWAFWPVRTFSKRFVGWNCFSKVHPVRPFGFDRYSVFESHKTSNLAMWTLGARSLKWRFRDERQLLVERWFCPCFELDFGLKGVPGLKTTNGNL